MKNQTFKFRLLMQAIMLGLLTITSCEKRLEVEPSINSDTYSPEDAIKNAQDMQQLLNSCYDACANMMNGQFQVTTDLLADDISRPSNNDGNLTGIYNRNTSIFNGWAGGAYSQPYYTIYRVNVMDKYYDLIEISEQEKNRMQGEGAFLRALCHLETVKLWAQPAGYTSSNSHLGIIERKRAMNEAIPRTSVASNYQYIIDDLNKAISLLPENNGVYANKMAAKALLAKVYYIMGRHDDALPLLNEVIAGGYTLSDSLNRFDRASTQSEVIFGFVTVGNPYDIGNRGATFKGMYRNDLLDEPNIPVLGYSVEIKNLLLSDTTDQRKKFVRIMNEGKSNEFYATTKFNMNDFAAPYLHLTEMYLIRAEIHAIKGNTSQAISDLNGIIRRAYLPNNIKLASVAGLTGNALLEEIRLQTRLELALEGQRLENVKRIGVSKGAGNYQVRNVPWDCPGMVLQFPSAAGTVKNFEFNPTAVCN